MPRIEWVEDADAAGQRGEELARIRAVSAWSVPDIVRTMSLRPDSLTAMQAASRPHFADVALTRAQHEMIASYVSALPRCHS